MQLYAPILQTNNLHISIDEKLIVNGLNVSIAPGSVHAIMGPNGSGKSTLSHTLAGHPAYTVTQGSILFDGVAITDWAADKRARAGMFLAFQQPQSIPGLQVSAFLYEIHAAVIGSRMSVLDFDVLLKEAMEQLSIDPSFAYRDLNDGFSGGERKRFELLQMMILKPKFAILDEIDSGLDIDALKLVAAGIARARKENPHLAILIITHYQRILQYLTPDHVHVLCNGAIVRSGDAALVHELEKQGYDAYR